ncbi:MAG: hypothetical protein VR67_07105 [Peptococcaceae bacterium BRH_c8a]|nr:MAG: hypothetical protein VR67_07105 [Peptococcaceae bacterium BRH_c8a]
MYLGNRHNGVPVSFLFFCKPYIWLVLMNTVLKANILEIKKNIPGRSLLRPGYNINNYMRR